MSKGTKQQSEIQEAYTTLRAWLPEGATVYTVLRHVSKSGMSRRIDLYAIVDGRLQYLSGYVGRVLGMHQHKNGGLLVNGCGMDMGYDTVHNLSWALYPHPADGRTGYTLRHEWI